VTRSFQFLKAEPVVPILLEWLNHLLSTNANRVLENDYDYWYWFLRQLDPMKGKYGARVRWRHIYPHWFRAQRASQLATDYGLELHEIGDWMKWEELDTARKYVGTLGTITDKMKKAEPSWGKIAKIKITPES